jgi:MerR family transcriptional regulator, heat shock protein HspR
MASKKDKRNGREPLLTIGAVSQMLEIHQQTLRKYEEEGLITPRRSEGGTRMYSLEDVERLRVILTLTRDLGLNLAGVEIVLRMRDELSEMQRMMDTVFDELEEPLRGRIRAMMQGETEAIVPFNRAGEGLVPINLLRAIMGDGRSE